MTNGRADPRWWQRLAMWLASTRVVVWIFSRTLHHVDRVLLNVSGGRLSIPGVFTGLPVVELTTTGAKTGEDRTVPVVGFRDGEKWILIASNWGDEAHPAWYHNLKANPEVTLSHDGQPNRYEAREATDDEREAYWRRAEEAYFGFDVYQQRAGDRVIPVVVLEPKGT